MVILTKMRSGKVRRPDLVLAKQKAVRLILIHDPFALQIPFA
jgi:hypothetical protein